jgi:cellulose synthase/poly-beta-1,6-N-acetylglucosamine synthase-like glycosyltransferase
MIREILIYLSAYIGLSAVIFYFLSLISAKKEKEAEFPEDNPPTVSIVIPAWNEAKGIAGTIKSALNLDYPDGKLEIIVIDDGSKDDTYNTAKSFEGLKNGKRVRVYKNKKNMGKGASMNHGIRESHGEIIVTMDADNVIVGKDILKNMIRSFTDPKIMCVAPTIAVYKPKGFLQRIQQVEYMLGVFLRKAFSNMNAIHITSGAFSVYKKEFFDKFGGFSENDITEDMEMALRIQYHNYRIINNVDAVAYTIAPKTFKTVLKQRRRWYTGLIKCFLDYRKLFSKKYGSMGVIVLPVAIITVILSVILTSYLFVNMFIDVKKDLVMLQSINYQFLDNIEFSKFIIERYFFNFFSDHIMILFLIFTLILVAYMLYAKRHVKENAAIKLSLPLFIFFYSFLFAFWWIIAFVYSLFNKKVKWR